MVETPRLAQLVCEVPSSAQSMPLRRRGFHGFCAGRLWKVGKIVVDWSGKDG